MASNLIVNMENKNGGAVSFLAAGARLMLRLPIALVRAVVATASDSSYESRPGILGKVIGWPPPRLDPSKETAWLDGLRGISSCLVVAFHFHLRFLMGLHLEAPYGSVLLPKKTVANDIWRLPLFRFFVSAGHAQVSIFFVLSGFVLSWKSIELIRTGQSERLLASLSSTVLRRWFRLYLPCFAVGLFAFWKVRMHVDVPLGIEVYPSIIRQFWDYIMACEAFARPLLRDRSHPNWLHKYSWIMWTIPLEFEGSLMVFILLLGMARAQNYTNRMLLLGFLVSYSCLLGYWTYWLFATGMMIADYVKEAGGFDQLSKQATTASNLFWEVILLLGIWMAGVPTPSPKFYDRPGYQFLDNVTPSAYREIEDGARFWWSLAGILMFFSGCHLKHIQRICETSLSQYLGRLSYMLYLTHSEIPIRIGSVFRDWFSDTWGTKFYDEDFKVDLYKFTVFPGIILFCVSWIICGISAIIVAHWCEVLVDRPSILVSKWIETRFTANEPPELRETGHRISEFQRDDAILLSTYSNSNNDQI